MGERVAKFESQFADFCQTRHAVAVASGTDALALSLRALGAGGGEVITSAHTAIATIAAIELAGATPVLADINPLSRCVDIGSVASLLNERTRAIVPVHIYGHPADINGLRKLVAGADIAIVEDCAQAHGATLEGCPVGGLGDAGAFSFYPTKTIGAMGDAGAIVTNSDELFRTLRSLRQYGWDRHRMSQRSGQNSRMDTLQAAILSMQLAGFEERFERRQLIAQRYRDALSHQPHIEAPGIMPGIRHGYHQFVVQCENRDALASALEAGGVESGRHYACPVHAHPAYGGLRRAESLAEVEKLYDRMLSIPIYPELGDEEVDVICHILTTWRGEGEGR
jgi:dTDP-4-amino-4,6-dideoxygalactose transaminase